MMVEYTHRHTHTDTQKLKTRVRQERKLRRRDTIIERQNNFFFAKMRTFLRALDTHCPNLEVLVFSLSTT